MDSRLWAVAALAAVALSALGAAWLSARRSDGPADRVRAAVHVAAIALATAANGACFASRLLGRPGAEWRVPVVVAVAFGVGSVVGVAFANRFATDPRRAALATCLAAIATLALAASVLPLIGTSRAPELGWIRAALPIALDGFVVAMPLFFAVRVLAEGDPAWSPWTWLASTGLFTLGASAFPSEPTSPTFTIAGIAGVASWAIAAATRPTSARPRDLR